MSVSMLERLPCIILSLGLGLKFSAHAIFHIKLNLNVNYNTLYSQGVKTKLTEEKPETFVYDEFGIRFGSRTSPILTHQKFSKYAVIKTDSCLFCGKLKTWDLDVLFTSKTGIKSAVTICQEDSKKYTLQDIIEYVNNITKQI